jgi:hypothetical protein
MGRRPYRHHRRYRGRPGHGGHYFPDCLGFLEQENSRFQENG